MKDEDIVDFKSHLKEFEATVKEEIKADAEYDGEAEHLLQALSRLQTAFETIKSSKDFEDRLGVFAKDFLTVQQAAMEFSDFEEDFDFDDLDCDDEDCCDEDCDGLEFAESEDEK